jgi:hypothetical protein
MIIDNYDMYINHVKQIHSLIISKKIELFDDGEIEYFTCFVSSLIDEIHNYCVELKDNNLIEVKFVNTLENSISEIMLPLFAKEISGKQSNQKLIKRKALQMLIILSCFVSPLLLRYFLKIYMKEYNNDLGLLFQEDKNTINIILYCCNTIENISELLTIVDKKIIFITNKRNISGLMLLIYNGIIQHLITKKIIDVEDFINFTNNNYNIYHVYALLGKFNFYSNLINNKANKILLYQKDKNNNIPLILAIKYNTNFAEEIIKSDIFDLDMLEIMITNYNIYLYEYMDMILNKNILTDDFINTRKNWFRNFFMNNNFNKINVNKEVLKKYVFTDIEIIKNLITTNLEKFKLYVKEHYNEIAKTIFYSKEHNIIKCLITNCPLIAYNMILDNKEYLYANNIIYNDLDILKVCLTNYEVKNNLKNISEMDEIFKILEEIIACSKFTINDYKTKLDSLNMSIFSYIITKLNKIFNSHISRQNIDTSSFVTELEDILFDIDTTINIIDIIINSNILQNHVNNYSINKLIDLSNINQNNAKYMFSKFNLLFTKEEFVNTLLEEIQYISNIKIFEYVLKLDILNTSIINKIIINERKEEEYLIHRLINSEQIKCLLKSRPDYNISSIKPNILVSYTNMKKLDLLKTVLLLEEIKINKQDLKEGFKVLLENYKSIEEHILLELIDIYIKLYDSLDLVNNVNTMDILFKLRHNRLRDILYELEDNNFNKEYFKMAINNNIHVPEVISRKKFTYKIVKELNIDLKKLVFTNPLPKIFIMALEHKLIDYQDLFKPLDTCNSLNICYKLVADNNYDFLFNLATYFKNNQILIQNESNSPLTYMIDKIDINKLKILNITKEQVINCKLVENLLKKNNYENFLKIIELYDFKYSELLKLKIQNEDIFQYINEHNVYVLENIKEDVFIDYLLNYNIGCLTSSRMKKYLLEDKVDMKILNNSCRNNMTVFDILINYSDKDYMEKLVNKIIANKIKLNSGLYFFMLHYYDIINLDIFTDIENQIKYFVKYNKDYISLKRFYEIIMNEKNNEKNYVVCLIYYLSIYEQRYITKFFTDYPEFSILTEKYNDNYLIFQMPELINNCDLNKILHLRNNYNQNLLHLENKLDINSFHFIINKLNTDKILLNSILERDMYNKNVLDYIFSNKNIDKFSIIINKLTEQEILVIFNTKLNYTYDTYMKNIIENYSIIDYDLDNFIKNNINILLNKNNEEIINLFYLIKQSNNSEFNDYYYILDYVVNNHLEYYFDYYDSNKNNGFMYCIKYNEKIAELIIKKLDNNNNLIKNFKTMNWLQLCIVERPNLITKIIEIIELYSEDIIYEILLDRIEDAFLNKKTHMNCVQYACKNNANSLDKLFKLKNKNILIHRLFNEVTEIDTKNIEEKKEEKYKDMNEYDYENKYNCFKLAVLYNSEAIDIIVSSQYYTDNIILFTDKLMKNTCINDAFHLNISSCFRMLLNNKIKINFMTENKVLINDVSKFFGYKNIESIIKTYPILKQNDEFIPDDHKDICGICYMHKCKIIFIPCQHQTCVTCSCKVNKCHICRADITSRVFIYK